MGDRTNELLRGWRVDPEGNEPAAHLSKTYALKMHQALARAGVVLPVGTSTVMEELLLDLLATVAEMRKRTASADGSSGARRRGANNDKQVAITTELLRLGPDRMHEPGAAGVVVGRLKRKGIGASVQHVRKVRREKFPRS